MSGGLSDPAVQDEPFAYYSERMAQCPVWHERDIDQYVIGGQAEIRESLMDVATYSSRPIRTRQPSDAVIA